MMTPQYLAKADTEIAKSLVPNCLKSIIISANSTKIYCDYNGFIHSNDNKMAFTYARIFIHM